MGAWTRVAATKAAEVCKSLTLGETAGPLLTDGLSPEAFVQELVKKECWEDAVRFLAHALPKREALWWACACVRQAKALASPEQEAALTAVETYVAVPTDTYRRAAWSAAETADLGTPAGCVGSAAFFSAGSLAPPDLPPVPPGELLTARGVANAILLSAVIREPENAAEKYQAFLDLGLAVAQGTSRWKDA